MPAKKSATPKKAKKSDALVFVTGSDEAEVKKVARELADELMPGDDPFAREVVDGALNVADEFVQCIESTKQALLTLPFFGKKLVWLKNAAFFEDSVSARSEAVESALEGLLQVSEAGLPEGIIFLISAPKADKRRSAYKRLSKLGKTHLHDTPDLGFRATEADLVRWVSKRASDRGMPVSSEAAALLAAHVGLDTRQIDVELEKLDLARGEDGKPDMALLRQLVPQTREGSIFDLSNAIGARDLPTALDCLEQLFRQRESAIGILLAAIVPPVRNLLVVKDLMLRFKLRSPDAPHFFAGTLKRLPEEALEHLPKKKDGTVSAYALGIAASNAPRFSLEELQRGFLACRETNLALVSGNVGAETVMSQLIVKLLAESRRTSN
ncbi:MAG: DNA polymerase III subunit delta [Chthoniobacterales bacterium]